jgi:hypothetical protein
MNVVGLATIAALFCGALASPALLAWSIYCLTRRNRRGEGLAVIGAGVFLATSLIVVGFLTAPRDSPRSAGPGAIITRAHPARARGGWVGRGAPQLNPGGRT